MCYNFLRTLKMAGTRHKARAVALQALYEVDSVARPCDVVIGRLNTQTNLTEENMEFVRGLINGTVKNRDEIDRHIKMFAPAWPVQQIAVIDRNILRLAIFEILFDNKVPVKVVINEAVELAKAYGSETSARFINGVLGSVSTVAGRE
jgi:N utilization substance protein B